jgi:hypothetical protein
MAPSDQCGGTFAITSWNAMEYRNVTMALTSVIHVYFAHQFAHHQRVANEQLEA